MKLALLALSSAVLLYGCGSSSEPSPEPPKEPTAQRWCSAVPALTTDSRTDRTGDANTLERVRRVQQRHADALMRCPGVTGHGIGKAKPSRVVHDPDVPPEDAKRVSDAEKDHLIAIYLLSRRDRPEQPLFLDGVRLRFVVTGPIQAL